MIFWVKENQGITNIISSCEGIPCISSMNIYFEYYSFACLRRCCNLAPGFKDILCIYIIQYIKWLKKFSIWTSYVAFLVPEVASLVERLKAYGYKTIWRSWFPISNQSLIIKSENIRFLNRSLAELLGKLIFLSTQPDTIYSCIFLYYLIYTTFLSFLMHLYTFFLDENFFILTCTSG